jgi:hypothetical protein
MKPVDLGHTQPSIHWVPGVLSLGVKLPGRELTTHLQLVPRSKHEWSYISTLSIRLHGVVLSKTQRQIYILPFFIQSDLRMEVNCLTKKIPEVI